MKEQIIKPDQKRGIDLLNRTLRLFPYNIRINEDYLISYRNMNYATIINNLWITIFDKLDKEGYQIFPPYSSSYQVNIEDYYRFIDKLVGIILENLNKIELKPHNEIYSKNRAFMILQHFFWAIDHLISYTDHIGGWETALKSKSKKGEISKAFNNIFGSIVHTPEDIWKSSDFRENINEILKELGYKPFSISDDGYLRYFGVTVESEETRRAYDILNSKNFDNVIKNIDQIFDHLSNKNYTDALANCRKALESFFKKFLINHKIDNLYDNKKTDEGTVSNLAETIKRNISKLFTFPKYSKNLDDKGFLHLIESSKYIVSGLANSGASHGKSTNISIKIEDVKVAFSFIILLINTLLPFEK